MHPNGQFPAHLWFICLRVCMSCFVMSCFVSRVFCTVIGRAREPAFGVCYLKGKDTVARSRSARGVGGTGRNQGTLGQIAILLPIQTILHPAILFYYLILMAPFKTSIVDFLGVGLGNKPQRSRAANIVASRCATFSLHSSSWRFSKRSHRLHVRQRASNLRPPGQSTRALPVYYATDVAI